MRFKTLHDHWKTAKENAEDAHSLPPSSGCLDFAAQRDSIVRTICQDFDKPH